MRPKAEDRVEACGACGAALHLKPISRRLYCDPCGKRRRMASDKARQKERRERNGHREKYRAYSLMKNYGLTVEAFAAMLEAQGGCGICGAANPGWHKDWHVDHDHATGKVRGILCQPCNLLVGLARDDTTILTRAASYLTQANMKEAA